MKLLKKAICVCLTMSMIIPTIVSCTGDNENVKESETVEKIIDNETVNGIDAGDDSKPDDGEQPYEPVYVTKTEKYQPESLRAYLESALGQKGDKFSFCDTSNAPYALQDIPTVSNLTLKKISIPVYKTGSVDGNGDLVFTVFVHNASVAGLKSAPLRKYELKISPAEYGLTANSTAMKYIDIDVSGYGIKLTAEETLGMYAPADTVIPAYVRIADPSNSSAVNEVAEYIARSFPQMQNGFERLGQPTMGLINNVQLYDLEWEKVYEEKQLKSEAEEQAYYDKLVALLKEKYSGKYVSIIGDSISTFDGLSNNPEYNASIGINHTHYKPTTTSPAVWEQTYWGRVIEETGMKLCVCNAWGGSTVYGRHEPNNTSWDWTDYKDSFSNRASQLHRNDGTTPDVIIVYMGVNDCNRGDIWSHGELQNLLKDLDPSEYKEAIDRWFSAVRNKTANGGYLIPGQSYTTVDQGYAIGMYNLQKNYPDAEIICIGLRECGSSAFTPERLGKYNFMIETLADYFGAIYVNQQGSIANDEMHFYGADVINVHPNSIGMEILSRAIIKAWGEYEGKK